jgi:transcriptional regulator of acetoin/glycerol metabolism
MSPPGRPKGEYRRVEPGGFPLSNWLPHLPHPPLLASPPERTALARERYFGEGQRPTGLVDEAVLQSWQRCLQQRRAPAERCEFEPVSRLRLDTALRRTRALREAAQGELKLLEQSLVATACTVLLVDPQGLIVYASQPGQRQDGLARALARPGVDVSERVLGTNAPGLVVATGRACALDGREHFFDQVAAMRCAAAPIRDIHGQLAGVLDLSVEHLGFGFDPAALVGLHAGAMERALRVSQSGLHTLVELHVHPGLLGTPGSGLMGIDEAGRVAWLDAAAERLVGVRSGVAGEAWDCEQVLGVGLARLRQLGGRTHASALPLPNGLQVWVAVRAPAGAAPPQVQAEAPAAAPAPASLAEQERAAILQALRACGGNVSEAARRLGISRGRVYRAMAPPSSS